MIKDSRELARLLEDYTIPESDYFEIAARLRSLKHRKAEGFLGATLDKLIGWKGGIKRPSPNSLKVKLPGFDMGKPPADLYAAMDREEVSFAEVLLNYIDKSDYVKDSDVYKKAGLSKGAFSKIRNGHLPKRENVLRLALVLRLSVVETEILLHAAGYAFQPNNKFDRFICFFLEEHEHGRDYDYDLLNLWCYDITGVVLVGEK